MNRRFPMRQVAATGEVQGGRQRSPHMTEGRVVPYLRVANVFDGYIDFSNVNLMAFKPREIESFRLKSGDILLNEGQSIELVGRCAMYTTGPEDCCFQNTLIRYRAGPETDAEFALQLFRYCREIGVFSRIAVKTNSIAHLGVSRFAELELPFPSLPEQRRIAEILRTWDEATEKLEGLRAAKRTHLAGLTHRLLGVAGAFPDRWQQAPLSAISTRIRRENGGGEHPVMTISAKSGFRLQSDKFSRDMAGSSVDRYIELHEGEFAYNKGNSLTAPYGCIFPLNRPTALVPFVYFCFSLNPGFNREFFAHLFSAGALNHQLSRLINSGVRNDGLLNLNPADFFGCKVPIPTDAEQRAIASALTSAKQEIRLLEKQIEGVVNQKRGLMQKLLTGEWRVNAGRDQ
ncbi:restriction endonuclease subunit S [Neorhizobium galegae]|uniref:restriction endonuclease subunit S n=1 Tax=Neorhizobium galegae TaxID=399 RepID=UPI002103CCFD|nr:restriction endonuclease subunit S [Neorhizobium galegae]MCQ1769558.1 restriction endonuclease subunit S [Neorhizobium galegae]MCQ1849607.1 restriction endonuclease subunit S [Neorhizobium galegae]